MRREQVFWGWGEPGAGPVAARGGGRAAARRARVVGRGRLVACRSGGGLLACAGAARRAARAARGVRRGARRPARAGAALPRQVVSGSAGAAGGRLLVGAGRDRRSGRRRGRRGRAAGVCRGGRGGRAVRGRDERGRRPGGRARAVRGARVAGSRAAGSGGLRRPAVADRGLRGRHPPARGRRRPARPRPDARPRAAELRVGDRRRLRRDPLGRPDLHRPRPDRAPGRGAGVRHAGRLSGDAGRAGQRRGARAARADPRLRGCSGRDHAGRAAGPPAGRAVL